MNNEIEFRVIETERTRSIYSQIEEKKLGVLSVFLTGTKAIIIDFILDPKIRNQGVGTQLLKMMETVLASIHINSIEVDFNKLADQEGNLIGGVKELKQWLRKSGFMENTPNQLGKIINK